MPFVDVRDLKMYYELQGEGPRLLFISGSNGDLRRKPNIFDTPVASQFEILAYDQRGLGQTSVPDGPYTMQDYAEDTEALLEALGWDSCLVMGTSFGGMVGQEFAARYPARIERLVLNCTSSGGKGKGSYPLIDLVDLDPKERFLTTLGISDRRRDAAWQAENAEQVAQFLEQAMTPVAQNPNPRAALGARLQLEARAELDVYARLPGMSMPVMACGGKYDGIAPPENMQAIASQIPNSRIEFFEGGHQFYAQDREAWPQIIRFLQGELDAEPVAAERTAASVG